jgi:hypothetical protein
MGATESTPKDKLLILLHKILHDETPLYLLNEILLHANHQSSYDLRFNQVFEPPFCNTTSYKCSKQQNSLANEKWTDIKVVKVVFNIILTGTP